MYKFLNKCAAEQTFSEVCSHTIMSSLDIDPDTIEECVSKSYTKPGNKKSINNILTKDRDWSRLNGLAWHPAVTINNYTYRGDLDGEDLFHAVCAGY